MVVQIMPRNRKGEGVHGWIILDKAKGMTSFQAVTSVKRLLNVQKVGHCGTLDPLATGVLPIALGEATKVVSYVVQGTKSYRFTVRWGQATDTDDAQGELIQESTRRPSEVEIRSILPRFTGRIEQIPPVFSAVKIAGRRAYDLARRGEEFSLEPRWVTIDRINLVEVDDPDRATFEITCGRGAYMRAIARDLGRALGCLGHIEALRRTAVGPFVCNQANSLERLEGLRHDGSVFECVLPLERALNEMPALPVSISEANWLRCGRVMPMLSRENHARVQHFANGSTIFAMSSGKPVAFARLVEGELRPVRVFNIGRGN